MFSMARHTEYRPASAMAWRPSTPGSAACGVVGDHHRQTGLEDAVDLDAGEPLGPLALERSGEFTALLLHVIPEGPADIGVGHEHEVPGLGEPHTRSAVGSVEDTHEDLFVNRLPVELGPHVAPAVDHVIEAGEHDRNLTSAGTTHPTDLHSRSARACRRTCPVARVGALVSWRLGPARATRHQARSQRPEPGVASRPVTDLTWTGDACSLVDAFRKGEITPPEALELSLAAIEGSALNAFSHVDADEARRSARGRRCDPSLRRGARRDQRARIGGRDGPSPRRRSSTPTASPPTPRRRCGGCEDAGAVLAGQTTASEFGGINVTYTRLHGATRNPWNLERTPGGSSGGTAAAVAGGLLPIASGGDGGGSIRIPASFTGMFGLKSNYGRIPKGPFVHQIPHTVTVGCIARSVRDTARWYDVCNGYDPHDTHSLPRVEGWEAGLGSYHETLRGKRAVIAVDLGVAVVHPEVTALVMAGAESLIADAALARASTWRSTFHPHCSSGPCRTS